jgi:hypothetical protein
MLKKMGIDSHISEQYNKKNRKLEKNKSKNVLIFYLLTVYISRNDIPVPLIYNAE